MANDILVCPICGEPTYLVYGKNPRKDRLCGLHSKMFFNKEIEQCPDCQAWHTTGEPCSCKAPKKEDKADDGLTCLTCDAPSNGKHFCVSCYHKYKNKILYLQIKHCSEFNKLDAEYQSDLVCDDGHLVKSPYEKIIDDWLYAENIKHAYEKKLDIDKDTDITPDFYIPEYNGIKNIYIEFWGYDESNIKYQRQKEYKLNLYPNIVERDKITVIYLTKKEIDNGSFKKKIKYADAKKIN